MIEKWMIKGVSFTPMADSRQFATFVKSDGSLDRISLNAYSDNDNLFEMLKACMWLDEPVFYDTEKKTIKIKDWTWTYYEKGDSWYGGRK